MRRDLTIIVSDRVREQLQITDIVAPRLAADIADEHEDLVDELGRNLAVQAIAGMVRNACKKLVEDRADSLFEWMGDKLPRAIAVPTEKKNECRYVALSRASVGDLHAAVDLLTKQIAADTVRRDALKQVLDTCLDHGASAGDLVADLVTDKSAAD